MTASVIPPDSAVSVSIPVGTAPGLFDRLGEGKTALLVLLFGLLLYVPLAGSYGLWDPWETHYGEVARQMVERGDTISLYWPGSPLDRVEFWSKPVLTFWLMSGALALAGLRGAAPGTFAQGEAVEWALRLPFCLMALLALYGVYLVCARLCSRRAGVLAAVVLATMPMFSLIARQAMTDMPFIGPMTLALALAVIALFDDHPGELPRKTARNGRLSWPHHPAFYVATGLFLLVVVPQLVTNAFQLDWRFRLGSKRLLLPGALVMVPYLAGAIFVLFSAARSRHRASLYLLTAASLAALAVLAKGLAGLGLPVIVLLAFVAFTWNWRLLVKPTVVNAWLTAAIAFLVVAAPWHHAMLVRHGKAFWSELYGDNHWRRMVTGRHGDRGSFEYFLRETAYAILPWLPFGPAALFFAIKQPAPPAAPLGARPHRRALFWLGAIWFVVAYAIVSFSMTKFHHYALPALPGLAIAIACFLDDMLDRPSAPSLRLAALAGVPLLALVTFDLAREPQSAQRLIWLFCYDYVNDPKGRPWPAQLNFITPLAAFAFVFALCALAASLPWRRIRRAAITGLCVAAVAFTFFLLDVYAKNVSDVWSQKKLVASYYRQRASPDERLIAWQMYWRGETFYTQNEIYDGPPEKRTVFLGTRNAEDLQAYLGRSTGKRVFFVVERTRLEHLRTLLPQNARASLSVLENGNNKFLLASTRL